MFHALFRVIVVVFGKMLLRLIPRRPTNPEEKAIIKIERLRIIVTFESVRLDPRQAWSEAWMYVANGYLQVFVAKFCKSKKSVSFIVKLSIDCEFSCR